MARPTSPVVLGASVSAISAATPAVSAEAPVSVVAPKADARKAAARARAPRKGAPLWVHAVRLGILAAILVAMEVAVSGGFVNRIFLASPTQIWSELTYQLSQGTLLANVAVTMREVFVGYFLAAAIGVGIGVVFVSFPRVEQVFKPFFSAMMACPKAAIMPLLVVWFGIGFQSKIVLVLLFCTFTILFNTISGAKQAREEHLKVARVFGASKAQIVFRVLIPSALPSIFTALRIAAAISITGAIFAEMTAAKAGAGFMLTQAQAVLDTPLIFLVVIVMTVISVCFIGVVDAVERLVCRNYRRV